MPIFYDDTDMTYNITIGDYRIKATVTASPFFASSWIEDTLRINGQCLGPVVVGLDVEWCPHGWHGTYGENPVAVLQLCVGPRCLIFQILHCDFIPAKLSEFFFNDHFRFVGVGIQDDFKKLDRQQFHFTKCLVESRVDELGELASEKMNQPFLRRLSLKELAWQLVGLQMEKPKWVCLSNWGTRVLNQHQIEYATLDAFASYKVGHRLLDGNFCQMCGRFEN